MRVGRTPFAAACVWLVLQAGTSAQTTALTLRDAVAEALVASPTLRGPADDRELAGIRLAQASARFGLKVSPTADVGAGSVASGSRSMGVALSKQLPVGTTVALDGRTTTFGNGATQFRDTGYTLGVSQQLLRGWTTAAANERDRSRRGTESAGRAFDDARQRLVVSVAETYFAVIRNTRLLEAAQGTLDRARQLKTVSDARASVGLATGLDVLRADLLMSQSDAALAMQREALESASDALQTLIGRPVGRDLALADTDAGVVDDPADEPVEYFISSALVRRAETLEARDRILDASRSESIARWNLFPPLTLDVNYTRRGLGGAADPFGAALYNGWQVRLVSSYALDHADQKAAAGVAAIAVSAARRNQQDTGRRLEDEVRRAYRSWTRTKATLAIQAKAVTIAERQLRLAQLRYDTGVAGNFDVIDAENGLLQAKSALIGAEVDRAVASLTLARVSGTLDPDRFDP